MRFIQAWLLEFHLRKPQKSYLPLDGPAHHKLTCVRLMVYVSLDHTITVRVHLKKLGIITAPNAEKACAYLGLCHPSLEIRKRKIAVWSAYSPV